jgi:hypothetical protein
MNEESNEGLITRYRSAARDETSASLDRAILDLARRRAARVRTARRGVASCALLVVAVALVTVSHRPHAMKATHTAARTDYGLQEGATRDYLLTVSAIPPGTIDWR